MPGETFPITISLDTMVAWCSAESECVRLQEGSRGGERYTTSLDKVFPPMLAAQVVVIPDDTIEVAIGICCGTPAVGFI